MNIFKATASASRTISRSRFQAYNLPSIYLRKASSMSHSVPKLNDPSLLKLNVAYVNGEWVGAKSGKTFEVTGTTPLLSIFKGCIADMYRQCRSIIWEINWNGSRI